VTAPDSVSALYAALSHPFRRIVLYRLREREPRSVEELAESVAACATSQRDDAGAPSGEEAVCQRLYHVHLLKLADLGLVTYDPDVGTVALDDLPPAADEVLGTAERVDARTAPGACELAERNG
jgi:DNA-binding transcriptional ArsR family regulator